MLNTGPQRPLYRFVAGLAGLAMISLGVAPILRRGDMFYTNWFGGLVFSPLAIVFGLCTIGCAVFKPSWLSATLQSPAESPWCRMEACWTQRRLKSPPVIDLPVPRT
jgi:hypothetical protein